MSTAQVEVKGKEFAQSFTVNEWHELHEEFITGSRPTACDELMEALEPIVHNTAYSAYAKHGAYVLSDRDDFVNEARLGAFNALMVFNPKQGSVLPSYVKQQVIYHLSNNVIRKGQTRQNEFEWETLSTDTILEQTDEGFTGSTSDIVAHSVSDKEIYKSVDESGVHTAEEKVAELLEEFTGVEPEYAELVGAVVSAITVHDLKPTEVNAYLYEQFPTVNKATLRKRKERAMRAFVKFSGDGLAVF